MDAYSSKDFSDVKIVCGEEVFDCHQVVLAARSPVFRAMFQSNMKEAQSRKVEVLDVVPEVFSELLSFIYTGMIPKLEMFAEELLAAANKYQLDQLKEICVNHLCSIIDVKNCLHYLVIGDIYQAEQLKVSSLQYLDRHKARIFKSKDWKENLEKHPHLLRNILTS